MKLGQKVRILLNKSSFEFNALSDSSNACFKVDLYAAGDELVSLNGTGAQASTLCWTQKFGGRRRLGRCLRQDR